MQRVLKFFVPCVAALAVACGDSARMPADLESDLALAAAGADLELASRPTDSTNIVGAVERTTPPARAIAKSTRAPRPRRSPTPRIRADVQPETEIVQEPQVAAAEQPMPAPVEEAPVQVVATTRPRPVEPVSSGGSGPNSGGIDLGTIIGIGGAVVIRGGGVGEDRCIPPVPIRRRPPMAINDRYPRTTRGSGRVNMGGRTGGRPAVRTAPQQDGMGGRTGGRPVVHSPLPRTGSPVASRPMPSPTSNRRVAAPSRTSSAGGPAGGAAPSGRGSLTAVIEQQ